MPSGLVRSSYDETLQALLHLEVRASNCLRKLNGAIRSSRRRTRLHASTGSSGFALHRFPKLLYTAHNRGNRRAGNSLDSPHHLVDFAGKGPIRRGQETQKAREDAMSHERRTFPVPPSEFSCLFSPIPKLASAARPPATRHRQRGIRLSH